MPLCASVLEQADNRDLKSCALWACGFDPRHSHHSKYQLLIQRLVLFFYPMAAQKPLQ